LANLEKTQDQSSKQLGVPKIKLNLKTSAICFYHIFAGKIDIGREIELMFFLVIRNPEYKFYHLFQGFQIYYCAIKIAFI